MAGAVGHFFAASMAIPFSAFVLTLAAGFFVFLPFLYVLVISAMTAAALFLHLVGFYGLWRNYGSRLAAATFVYGLVAIAVLLAALPFVFFTTLPFASSRDLSALLGAVVLMGVMLILEGTTYIVNRAFLRGESAIAAGSLLIIAGAFLSSVLFAPIGGVLAMPGMIIGGVVLVRAQIPVPYAGPSNLGPFQPPPSGPSGTSP